MFGFPRERISPGINKNKTEILLHNSVCHECHNEDERSLFLEGRVVERKRKRGGVGLSRSTKFSGGNHKEFGRLKRREKEKREKVFRRFRVLSWLLLVS